MIMRLFDARYSACAGMVVAGQAVRGKSWSRAWAPCSMMGRRAVDQFGGAGVGVAGEAGDFLDGNAAVGHEADEGAPQFAWCPGPLDAGGSDGGAELAADVGGVQLAAISGGEHEAGVPAFALAQVA